MEFELRKWKKGDAAQIARCANNENIAANLRDGFPHPYTMLDALRFIAACLSVDEKSQLFRAISVDGKAVGSISISVGGDIYRRTAELGYWLAEDYWGQGIVTEAVRRMCNVAFETCDIVRIYAEPFAKNSASRRVLEKNSFEFEGTMRNGAYKNDEILDYCVYALLK